MLLTNCPESRQYIAVETRHVETTIRGSLRNAGPAHPENSRNHGDAAWLRHRPADRTGLRRRLAIEPGLGPPRSDSPSAGRLDTGRPGDLGDKPQGQVLF